MTKRILSFTILLLFVGLLSLTYTNISKARSTAVSPTYHLINGFNRSSSPVLTDMDNDNRLEIIVGTKTGHLVATEYYSGAFNEMWDANLGSALGSSPAVGDVDGDGDFEIAIGVGYSPTSEAGSIALLDHHGNILWQVVTKDRNAGPDGVPDGVFSTPALGDLNNDGFLEVVVAGYDEFLYAIDYQGNALPGWPIHLLDNTWGSPALADLNEDGYQDVIVGSYANKYIYPCPDMGCGLISVYNYQGNALSGWPKLLDGHIDSSPAVADLDNDGDLEFVIGTGQNSDFPSRFNKVYAFEANGSYMNGWPQDTGGYVFSSPAIADVDGDNDYEIFVGAADGLLYGWHHNGQSISGSPGWPVAPKNQNGDVQSIAAASPTIVDADGDGSVEIFIATGWDIVGFEVNGDPMGSSYRFSTKYSIGSTPAWGDIDNDNKLELVIANGHYNEIPNLGRINVWDTNTTYNEAAMPWPMWRQNARRLGRSWLPPSLASSTTSLFTMHQIDSGLNPELSFSVVNDGESGSIEWSANASNGRVSVSPVSGVVQNELDTVMVTIDTTGLLTGTHDLGMVTLTGMNDGVAVAGSPVTIDISLYVGQVHKTFLPTILR